MQGEIWITNLVLNGDAEAGPDMTSIAVKDIPGWTIPGAFTVGTYGGTPFTGNNYGATDRSINLSLIENAPTRMG
jgi:hypothetical protein